MNQIYSNSEGPERAKSNVIPSWSIAIAICITKERDGDFEETNATLTRKTSDFRERRQFYHFLQTINNTNTTVTC